MFLAGQKESEFLDHQLSTNWRRYCPAKRERRHTRSPERTALCSCMGGVDYADQKRNEYRIPVKSRSWYRYLAFFLFETAIVNAYILRQLSPNHGGITQLDFRLELLDKLIGNYSSRKRKRASTDIEVLDGKSHFPVRVTLNRCVYCASRNHRHRSTWGCVLCDVTLCVSCFEPFHTR